MAILITGAAGFIGYHLSKSLMAQGHSVVGIDNMNDYYPPTLKQERLNSLQMDYSNQFTFHVCDIADAAALKAITDQYSLSHIYHLAAQAGVRYSIENPAAYVQSNMVGHANILEIARHGDSLDHLIYASSSSVYGDSATAPFKEEDITVEPKSLYAATKRSDELMSRTYSHLYGIPASGLRFFTVYGPWGRPDMAPWLFTDAILNDRPIKVFNNGDLRRDFTYVDDIVNGCVGLLDTTPKDDPALPHSVYNIGNNKPVQLMTFIETIEDILGKKAEKIMHPMQAGDVYETSADISKLNNLTGFTPETNLHTGLSAFIQWFKAYHSA